MSDFLGKPKDFLDTDKGEQASDKALDAGAAAAQQRFGDGHEEQIEKIRDAADTHLGDQ